MRSPKIIALLDTFALRLTDLLLRVKATVLWTIKGGDMCWTTFNSSWEPSLPLSAGSFCDLCCVRDSTS